MRWGNGGDANRCGGGGGDASSSIYRVFNYINEAAGGGEAGEGRDCIMCSQDETTSR